MFALTYCFDCLSVSRQYIDVTAPEFLPGSFASKDPVVGDIVFGGTQDKGLNRLKRRIRPGEREIPGESGFVSLGSHRNSERVSHRSYAGSKESMKSPRSDLGGDGTTYSGFTSSIHPIRLSDIQVSSMGLGRRSMISIDESHQAPTHEPDSLIYGTSVTNPLAFSSGLTTVFVEELDDFELIPEQVTDNRSGAVEQDYEDGDFLLI
jgi:hypothetical protein